MTDDKEHENDKEVIDHGIFHILHKKILNNEFLLIQIENSGIIKIKHDNKGVLVVTYTSSSNKIEQLFVIHEDMKK